MAVDVSSLLRLLERYELILEWDGEVRDAMIELDINWADETEELRLVREGLGELQEGGVKEV